MLAKLRKLQGENFKTTAFIERAPKLLSLFASSPGLRVVVGDHWERFELDVDNVQSNVGGVEGAWSLTLRWNYSKIGGGWAEELTITEITRIQLTSNEGAEKSHNHLARWLSSLNGQTAVMQELGTKIEELSAGAPCEEAQAADLGQGKAGPRGEQELAQIRGLVPLVVSEMIRRKRSIKALGENARLSSTELNSHKLFYRIKDGYRDPTGAGQTTLRWKWLEAHDHKVEVLRDTPAPGYNQGGIMRRLIETFHMKEADISALGFAAGTQTGASDLSDSFLHWLLRPREGVQALSVEILQRFLKKDASA